MVASTGGHVGHCQPALAQRALGLQRRVYRVVCVALVRRTLCLGLSWACARREAGATVSWHAGTQAGWEGERACPERRCATMKSSRLHVSSACGICGNVPGSTSKICGTARVTLLLQARGMRHRACGTGHEAWGVRGVARPL